MLQSNTENRRVVLARRPQGLPDTETLRLESSDITAPNSGEMLLRTKFLSLDPYMRGRMNDAKSYAEPVKIRELMTGQVVAQVVTYTPKRDLRKSGKSCRSKSMQEILWWIWYLYADEPDTAIFQHDPQTICAIKTGSPSIKLHQKSL